MFNNNVVEEYHQGHYDCSNISFSLTREAERENNVSKLEQYIGSFLSFLDDELPKQKNSQPCNYLLLFFLKEDEGKTGQLWNLT